MRPYHFALIAICSVHNKPTVKNTQALLKWQNTLNFISHNIINSPAHTGTDTLQPNVFFNCNTSVSDHKQLMVVTSPYETATNGDVVVLTNTHSNLSYSLGNEEAVGREGRAPRKTVHHISVPVGSASTLPLGLQAPRPTVRSE
jgi:hypothetical protein